MSAVLVHGTVMSAERAAVAPADAPVWARLAHAFAVCGIAAATSLIALLDLAFRGRRRRGQALAAGAASGYVVGRHARGRPRAHVWRLDTTTGIVVTRMAGGVGVDGLVVAGDHLTLRGRFTSSGVFNAYRGINTTAGLRLSPRHVAGWTVGGVIAFAWLALVAFDVLLR